MTFGYTERCTGGFKRFWQLALFTNAQGHMTSTCPGVRRLGVGAPITVLQFAPLARLRSVLGFHAIYYVCARFISEGVRFVDAETASLKGELPGGLTSSFFDRLRCRKSPVGGFWTL
jgi:hypothetical protein